MDLVAAVGRPVASPQGGDQPLATGLLATLTYVQPYPFVARRCRFTYSQSRFVMPDGGSGVDAWLL